MVPERYALGLSLDEWEAHCAREAAIAARRQRDREDRAAEEDAIAREAERVATIRASMTFTDDHDDNPGFRGLRYVGDAHAPVAVFR